MNDFERIDEMKRCVLGMLLAVMFLPAAVAQEFEPEKAEIQMKIRQKEMELQGREAKMEMDRRMAELELEKAKIGLERLRKAGRPHPLLLVVLVVHILTAVWVYQDIRQRGSGSGIWIVIALLAGLLGTLVYAVVRLGDAEKKKA